MSAKILRFNKKADESIYSAMSIDEQINIERAIETMLRDEFEDLCRQADSAYTRWTIQFDKRLKLEYSKDEKK